MKKRNCRLFAIVLVLIFTSCEKINIPVDVQNQIAQLPDEIDYNFQVKQILSDKCFACHGPDSKKQKVINIKIIIWYPVLLFGYG